MTVNDKPPGQGDNALVEDLPDFFQSNWPSDLGPNGPGDLR